MSSTDLLAPILDGGIASVNFFNGRLLSGEDLSAEQSANREARRQLGRALGDGIAAGLEVGVAITLSTAAAPVLTVNAGLEVNRRGQTLALPTQTDVALVQPSAPRVTEPTGFADCPRPVTTAYVSGNEGIYVLVLAPASGGQGRGAGGGVGHVVAGGDTPHLLDRGRVPLLAPAAGTGPPAAA